MVTECEACAHSIEKTETEKGHKEVAGSLICLQCEGGFEVCKTGPGSTAPAAPTTLPPIVPVQQTPQDVETLAKAVATQVTKIRNEIIWRDLQQPGVVVQAVDGGFIVESRWGYIAVRPDIDSALAKAKEWLSPPK